MKRVKTTILMITAISIAVSVTSCGSEKKAKEQDQMVMEADKNTPNEEVMSMTSEKVTFKDESLNEAFQHYVHVRTALTNTDATETKNGADMLVKSLENVSGAEVANAAAKAIVNASDIQSQRAEFFNLNEAMITLVKSNIESGELYLAYCPMANNNSGANWISSSKDIMNPYFGDKMLKCGSIKETLAKL